MGFLSRSGWERFEEVPGLRGALSSDKDEADVSGPLEGCRTGKAGLEGSGGGVG